MIFANNNNVKSFFCRNNNIVVVNRGRRFPHIFVVADPLGLTTRI